MTDERKISNFLSLPQWKKFSEYHWQLKINGKQLDYWPTTGRWRYNNITHKGTPEGLFVMVERELNPKGFIAPELGPIIYEEKPRPSSPELRREYAKAALTGIQASLTEADMTARTCAELAFELADAMIAAESKPPRTDF